MEGQRGPLFTAQLRLMKQQFSDYLRAISFPVRRATLSAGLHGAHRVAPSQVLRAHPLDAAQGAFMAVHLQVREQVRCHWRVCAGGAAPLAALMARCRCAAWSSAWAA